MQYEFPDCVYRLDLPMTAIMWIRARPPLSVDYPPTKGLDGNRKQQKLLMVCYFYFHFSRMTFWLAFSWGMLILWIYILVYIIAHVILKTFNFLSLLVDEKLKVE